MLLGIALSLSGLLCYYVGRNRSVVAADARVWLAASAVLTVIGFVSMLALDVHFARAVARFSFRHGWYENRRLVQGPIVGVVVALVVLAWIRLAGTLRSRGVWERVVAAATLSLACFIAVRAISFHDADRLLGLDDGHLASIASGIVAVGVGVVALAAWRRLGGFGSLEGFSLKDLAAPCAVVAVLAWAWFPRSSGLVSEAALQPVSASGFPSVGGFVAVGTALKDQPGALRYELPDGATVRQALLYWAGEHTGTRGDATIELNGQAVEGIQIGGPTYFYTWFDRVNESAYRADVTSIVKASAGEIEVNGLSFDVANSGAGLVVLYELPGASASVSLHQGLDLAFGGFDAPRDRVAEQTFRFPASDAWRRASVTVMASAVDARQSGKQRPSAIEIRVGSEIIEYLDPLGQSDDGWDLLTFDIDVPPGESSVAVELVSEDRTMADLSPVSFAWIFAGFQLRTD